MKSVVTYIYACDCIMTQRFSTEIFCYGEEDKGGPCPPKLNPKALHVDNL